ncbi:HTH-type quorum sensing-dependent transcriptional regulator VjbR [Aquimixticola soesokkakensis]|uniref:HTH-type quorum sensing-dependent transcriptional regulator VjbR n=1 Tax=Aquimixticola soesokkakensis TaxID=1519096 RepID=A0A1Y5SZW1_9RHOB|nr:LuxR family transcriptional regulator [Aquimixticola soesokkakensis]SLN52536.1 HTH-type quorum sensing-dependent transcriptional regulator VjbR [Aquimixticola soesokkakensis]
MTLQTESLLDSIQAAETLEAFQTATEDLRDALAVKHVVYHWVNSIGERFGAGTYSSDWVDRYLEKDYLRLDPVIFGCFQRFTPVNWKQLDWSSKGAKAMFLDALDYGLGNQGYTIPIRGPNGQFALFTLNADMDDDKWDAFIDKHGRELVLLGHEFNRKALEFEQGKETVAAPTLSPREQAAMTAMAKGYSRAQAAADLGISEHTLRVYIEAARHKLGALNTTHAVARALSSGLIIV